MIMIMSRPCGWKGWVDRVSAPPPPVYAPVDGRGGWIGLVGERDRWCWNISSQIDCYGPCSSFQTDRHTQQVGNRPTDSQTN